MRLLSPTPHKMGRESLGQNPGRLLVLTPSILGTQHVTDPDHCFTTMVSPRTKRLKLSVTWKSTASCRHSHAHCSRPGKMANWLSGNRKLMSKA